MTLAPMHFTCNRLYMYPGSEELQKARDESQVLDAELKKHRDKVLMLKNTTKLQIDELEANLEQAKNQHVSSVFSNFF